MDKKEGSFTNFMPGGLLEIICILERGEKHNPYKIVRKRNYFLSLSNFPPRMENHRHSRTTNQSNLKTCKINCTCNSSLCTKNFR